MEDSIMNLSDAADYLGVTLVTLRKKIKDGDLAASDDSIDSRQKLVKRSDLDKFLQGRGINPEQAFKLMEMRRKSRLEERSKKEDAQHPETVGV
jgi:excisionase family DNA binding protein